MSFDRSDFDELRETSRRETMRAQYPDMRRLAQAVVPAEAVTRDENWDFLLSILQREIELTDAAILDSVRTLRSHTVVAYEELVAAKIQVARLETKKETLEQVIGLPARIIALGEHAARDLRLFEAEDATEPS